MLWSKVEVCGFCLAVMFSWALGVLIPLNFYAFGQTCQQEVLNDWYFQPMTEMAGEKLYPDVIIIENDLLQVLSVPNRGRLLFDIVHKITGNSQLANNRTPLPLRFRGMYTFEFGGVYTTFPWHKRDNQPLPLEVGEPTNSNMCVTLMEVVDPETSIQMLASLELSPTNPEVILNIDLHNPRDHDQVIDIGLVVAARPGGKASSEMEVLIPTSTVRIGENEGGWMGEKGTETTWPMPWSRWGNFNYPGAFYFDVRKASTPEIIVYNPVSKESLHIKWESQAPWTTCEIFSWGPNYSQVMGAYDGFRIELRAEGLKIPANNVQRLKVTFTVGYQG